MERVYVHMHAKLVCLGRPTLTPAVLSALGRFFSGGDSEAVAKVGLPTSVCFVLHANALFALKKQHLALGL